MTRDNLAIDENPVNVADPRFDSNPGEVSWRDVLAQRSIDVAQSETWVPMIPRGAAKAGRPADIPYDALPASLGPTLQELKGDTPKLRDLYYQAIGGKRSVISTPDNDSIIVSGYLFDHLPLDGREAYFPLIRPVLEDPFEIWLMPVKGDKTGRIMMRKRFIRFFEDEKRRHLMLVGEYQQGSFVGYTFFRGERPDYFNRQRKGWLLYGR